MKKTQSKIIVGLSGGVDSAVSAFLLKEQGYDVTGIYMQNWIAEKNDPNCNAEKDLSDAFAISKQLNIPFETVNFSKEYWEYVFQHCLDELVANRTPNPDIGCNQYIKFDLFLKHALKLGSNFLATGHYARCTQDLKLQRAVDLNKDQTYFLYTLDQEKLSKIIFPIGNLIKPDVRAIAKKAGLLNYDKKDSTGICFIGERKFKEFLQNYILTRPGEIRSIDGKLLGQHEGLMFYTLGQRQGLKIGGQKNRSELPWYVVSKEIKNNILVVAQGENHPALFSSNLICKKINWISNYPPAENFNCTAKIRYRQIDQSCSVVLLENHSAQVTFDISQRAITPGQSIVFYDNDICLGGGIII